MKQAMKEIAFIILLMTTFFNVSGQDILQLQADQQKDDSFFDYEDYEAPNKPIGDLIFLKGCSWYCAGKVGSIKASSFLHSDDSSRTYLPQKSHDFDYKTAWVEGESGYGIGEWISYTFDYSETPDLGEGLGVNKLLIANGYKKSRGLWEANSRIKKMKMYVNGKPYALVDLLDSFEIQTVDFDTIKFGKEPIELRFEILEVYKGTKYKDTALSLLMFDGVGGH